MAWFPSHQSLARHPKTHRLMARLKTSRAETVGHLNLFWWWCLDYAPDGALTGFSAEEVAIAMEWDGDANALLDALIFAGFIDQTDAGLVVHDWDEYGGKILRQKSAHRDRMRETRASYSTAQDDTDDDCDAHVTSTDDARDAHVRTQIREEKRREENIPPVVPRGDKEQHDSPPAKPAKRAHQLSDDFTVTDDMRAWAAEHVPGVPVDAETENFRDHHRAKGSVMKDWTAAWRTWMRNAVKFGRVPAVAHVRPAPDAIDPVAKAVAEKERLLAGEWSGHYERTKYTVPPSGADNLARQIAYLDGIIAGREAA
jgi:hypothetical protein